MNLSGTPIAALVLALSGTTAWAQPDATPIGVTGRIVAHDGTVPTGGSVTMQSIDRSSVVTASLDASGRFLLVPSLSGRHRLTITVPDYAPSLVDVVVPSSRTIVLPALLLDAPTYFRARFVNSDGEALLSPVIRRRSLGAESTAVSGIDTAMRVAADGTVTIGPLPVGVTMMAIDMPGLAQTRLPDLTVRSAQGIIDGGTIVVRPGTALTATIVDRDGTPVVNHAVMVADVQANSPLTVRSVRTDRQGRATFERLGPGRYRVSTPMLDGCNGRSVLPAGEQITVNGTGNAAVRIVLGGSAALRITSPQGVLGGRTVSVSPAASEDANARTVMMPGKPPIVLPPPSCGAGTDGDGRATFTHLPEGAARVSVRMHQSTFERRVELRGNGDEATIVVPDGVMQVRVVNAATGQPVERASVTWSGGGYRIMATTTGSGDVLLEGVGDSPGAIEVSAPGFLDSKGEVAALAAPLEVALTPVPSGIRDVRVVADTGEAIANAIVLLAPATIFDVGVYAATDKNGVVRFANVAPAAARVEVQAEGFVGAAVNLPANSDAPVTLTLSRVRR